MRLLVSWLKDFVEIDAPAEEIAERVGLRGFEVAGIESLDGPGGNDAVIDFEVTANRPDCLSVLGLAREVATIYNLPITLPELKPLAVGRSSRLSVSIDEPELCPRYAAAVADVTDRDLAGMDDRAAAGRRHPIDQLDRGSDELRPDGARPSDARIRSGKAGRT